jgi:hypothetical protein
MSIIIISVRQNKVIEHHVVDDVIEAENLFKKYLEKFVPSFKDYLDGYKNTIIEDRYHCYANGSFVQMIELNKVQK